MPYKSDESYLQARQHYEDTADVIRNNPQWVLTRARKNINSLPSFICPFCNNGSGKDGTGIASKDGIHWKCFKCGFSGDVIDIIAKMHGIPDGSSRAAFDKAREICSGYLLNVENGGEKVFSLNAEKTPAAKKEEQYNFDEYLTAHCTKEAFNAEALNYLNKRGLDAETACRLSLGYDSALRAVVIPQLQYTNGQYAYHLRYISGSSSVRYSNPKGTSAGIFNAIRLQESKPCIVTEGAFDAASFERIGFNAISIQSTANAENFTRFILEHVNQINVQGLLICMDNDAPGDAANNAIIKELAGKTPFPVEVLSLKALAEDCPNAKDANDFLVNGYGDKLKAHVSNNMLSFIRTLAPVPVSDPDSALFENNNLSALLCDFDAFVNASKETPVYKTGFNSLDMALGGGLLPRLYVIGALSSLGKTTFALQICDNIAQNGRDVLIFSLEMAQEDLIARSISRHTYTIAHEHRHDMTLARTELDIIIGTRYAQYTPRQIMSIDEAKKRLRGYADRVSIFAGRRTADEIRDITQRYIKRSGAVPVVFIDYLQIIAPSDALRRATVREQVDNSVDVLAAMRRELKTPIICISSFNRNSYNTAADNSSFKESGSIEYTADAVLTLELTNVKISKDENAVKEATREAMRENTRAIKLTFQKNRGNRIGSQIFFKYYPQYNYFEEDAEKANDNVW